MSESGQARKVVLVEPHPEQHEQLEQDLSGWDLVDVPMSRIEAEPDAAASSADVLMVFAETHNERRALEVSQRVRSQHRLDGVPLLVAITIYQMPLAHEVEKLPNATFVFRPIDKTEFQQRIEEVREADRPGSPATRGTP